jgi:hypothetical protein
MSSGLAGTMDIARASTACVDVGHCLWSSHQATLLNAPILPAARADGPRNRGWRLPLCFSVIALRHFHALS